MDAYSSGSSQSSFAWNPIKSDFMINMSPGTYLLRKDRWNNPKYYATLTGVYDGYSGRIKFGLNERDEIPYELLYEYVMDHTDGRDMDTLHRKVHMASFIFKCGKYNSHLDSRPLSSQGELIRLHYDSSLTLMLAELNENLRMLFDSYAIVSTGIIGPSPTYLGSPGTTKRKANDGEQNANLNDKRVKLN